MPWDETVCMKARIAFYRKEARRQEQIYMHYDSRRIQTFSSQSTPVVGWRGGGEGWLLRGWRIRLLTRFPGRMMFNFPLCGRPRIKMALKRDIVPGKTICTLFRSLEVLEDVHVLIQNIIWQSIWRIEAHIFSGFLTRTARYLWVYLRNSILGPF